jgi:hypothetical protein
MVHTTPGIFQPARQPISRRAILCVEAQDGHFEYFLQHSGGRNYENMLNKTYFHGKVFSFILV